MTTARRARGRDLALRSVTVLTGAALLGFGLAVVSLLAPIADPVVVAVLTAGFLGLSVMAIRVLAARHAPIDPARPSAAGIRVLVDELAAGSDVARPGVTMDDSPTGRAIPNVAAVEMGRGTETLIVTEQIVADLDAGRLPFPLLRGVVLHELGHLAYDHSLLRLWLAVGERLVRVAALVALAGLVVIDGALEFAGRTPLAWVAILLGPMIVSVVVAAVGRAQEFQADAFAVRHEAGAELTGFFRWMQADLAPVFAFQRTGVPRDPAARAELRAGLEGLVRAAEADGDAERAAFFKALRGRFDDRVAEVAAGVGAGRRASLVARRWLRTVALAWVGEVRWSRSHPDIDVRLDRIAAGMGSAGAGRGTRVVA